MRKPKIIALLVLLFLLSGCASIETKPFEDFSKAVSQANTPIDGVMGKNYDWEKNNFCDTLLGKENSLTTLRIKRNGPFQLVAPDSLFTTLADVRLTLRNINEATMKYAGLLVTLSGSSLIDPKTFEEMATDVNNSMNSVCKSLDLKVPGDAIPVFSLAASEIGRLAVERQRRAALEKVLRSGQPSIERYAAKVISLIGTLEQSLYFSYGKRFDGLNEQFIALPLPARTNNKDARARLEEVLKLNDEYAQTVGNLLEIKHIYESLPKAHRQLLEAVENPGTGGFQAIGEIAQSAMRLQRIYGELATSK